MKKQKKIIIGIVAGLVLLAAVGIFLVVFFLKKGNEEAYRLIKIESFNGDVYVVRSSDEEIDIFEGQRLISKDEVTTEEEAGVTLLVDSDKHIVAEENTRFSIQAKGDEEDGKVTIHLEYGNALFEIDNPLPEEQTFEVETSNAVCSVRGTTFRVIYDSQSGITTVMVTEGVVHVEDKNHDDEIEITAGESVTVSEEDGIRLESEEAMDEASGNAPVIDEPAPMDETDASEAITPVNSLGTEDDDFRQAQTGDIIYYGTYESSYYGETMPLAWDVIYCDEEKILLVTHNVIAYGPYDSGTSCSWETSELRENLNTVYYNQFFTDSEKAYVMDAVISNPATDMFFNIYHPQGAGFDDDRMPDTTDKLFLLNWEELVAYYGIIKDQYDMPYFETMGSVTDDTGAASLWWIRSNTINEYGDSPIINNYNGMGFATCSESYGIRPAMFISMIPVE